MYCFIKYSIYALIFGRFFIKLLKFQYYFYTPLKFSSITRTKALPECCYCVTEVNMKKPLAFVVSALIICLTLFTLAACDGTSGRSDTVTLTNFRDHGRQFVFPVEVTKADTGPTDTRHFRSKLSLDEIYESILSGTDHYIEKRDGYLLVTDLSGEFPAYAYIAPYSSEENSFNYLMTNMGYNIADPRTDTPYEDALVPLFFIGVPADSVRVETGKEYPLYGTKEEIKDFYISCGYAVTETENTFEITDITGKKYSGGEVSFDDVAENFTITFTESGAIYTLPQPAESDGQNENGEEI